MSTVIPVQYNIGDTDTRPWGKWVVLDTAAEAVVKKITVLPGKRLSLQRHKYRSELWVVLDGVANVLCDDKSMQLHTGEWTFIPRNCIHRLSNESADPMTLLEIQYGDQLSEDDIERFDDDYGRTD